MHLPKETVGMLSQLLPLASLLLLLFSKPSAAAFAASCRLKRAPEVCPRGNRAQEIFCLRQENTLRAVMDCVQYNNLGVDHQLCSNPDDRIPGNNNEDFGDPFTGELSDPNANCLAPRQVLVEASRVCYGCSLGGLLLSCPEGDPNFHSCLCSHRIDSLAFTQLAKCFLRSTLDDLSCFSFARRNDFVKRDDYEPPPGMVANMKRNLFALEGADFFLDDFARPVYPDGSIGYPLPYYDRAIRRRTAIRRCFISPVSTDRWCISWRVNQPIGSDWDGGGYSGAQYGKSFDENGERSAEEEDSDDADFPEPTRTHAPSTTVLPTLAPVTDTPKAEVSQPEDNGAQGYKHQSIVGVLIVSMLSCILFTSVLF